MDAESSDKDKDGLARKEKVIRDKAGEVDEMKLIPKTRWCIYKQVYWRRHEKPPLAKYQTASGKQEYIM